MLQEALIVISSFKLVFKYYVASALTIITNIFIYKIVTPIPNLENYLFLIKKACA
jgi:hypothetical protein